MDIINKKNAVTQSVNELLKSLNEIDIETGCAVEELNNKNKILNQMNKKLINEISDKDKLINIQQHSISDYEKQITSFIPVKEEEDENKFGMVKAQAKEITNLTNTITSLRKELEQVNSKLEVLSSNDNNVSCEVIDLVEEEVNKVEDEVEEVVVNKVEEVIVNKVEDEVVVNKVEEEVVDSDESVDIEYVTKKIKNVRYFVEKDNPNSKIFSILDDGDVGDIVGEIKDGKKKIYKK
mgnify:CR=1 FL=1